jgi:signal transduction histidine kinase/CHASE3 domain sensor protein
MKLGLTARALLTVVGLTLLAVVTFGLLARAISRFDHATAESNTADASIEAANQLEVALFNFTVGERAYLASGNPVFLDRYRLGLRQYRRLSDELVSSVHDPVQLKRVKALSAAIEIFVNRTAVPTVALAQRDLPAARAFLQTAVGEHELADIVTQFDVFIKAEQGEVAEDRAAASAGTRQALEITLAGFFGIVLLAILYVALMERTAVRPIQGLLKATRRISKGELTTRVAERGAAEIRDLERGFNSMAESLEHHRDEIEAQHVELEAQHHEIEDALGQVAEEKAMALELYDFAEQLIAQVDVQPIAQVILERMARAAGAEVGTLYALPDEEATTFSLAAVRGIDAAKLPAAKSPGDGIAARVLEARGPVQTRFGEGGLHVSVFGEHVALHNELHVPLLLGERMVGVVTLGRLHQAPFDEADEQVVRRMADRGSIALNNGLARAQSQQLASRNETLLSSSVDGVRLVDLDGGLIAENAQMREMLEELLGANGAPVEGSHFELAEYVADRTTAPGAYRKGIEEIRANPDVKTEHEFEFAATGRVLRRFTAPVIGTDGVVVGTIFTLREVTGERQLQRLKDEFVATVTHELRTPLTSIVGFVELLLSGEPGVLTDDQRNFLGIVERNSERLLRLVSDLLFVARLEAGQLELERREVNLDTLVAESVEAVRPAAEQGQITVEFAPAGVPVLEADAGRLAQLVDNLLSNAVKFTPPGGGVDVATTVRGDTAILTVSDTGIGIPDAEKDHLFQRFFRASSAAGVATPGTGLGLSITKAIVEAHGGSIAASDRSGGGTTFTVQLPLNAVRVEAAAA